MVLVKTSLHDVAGQVRHLLSCASAHILLGCPVSALRHTAIECASQTYLTVVAEAGRATGATLLHYERVRALCDIALYRGQLSAMGIENTPFASVAVVPVERPAGVLGLLLLTDALPNAFGQGEHLLLQRMLPHVALALEEEAPGILTASGCGALLTTGQPVVATRRTSSPSPPTSPMLAGGHWQRSEVDPLKNGFLSMLSHELRSPLTAIKGYAILLQAYGLTDELAVKEAGLQSDGMEMTPRRQREYLDIIIEQTGHLEVLIQDLLDISRLQAGRLTLRSARVDIAQLCRRALQLVQQRAEAQSPGRYTFHSEIDTQLPLLWTDAHRVQQILTNLLENAMKYSPEGGLIELHACLHGTSTADSVYDAVGQLPLPDILAITVRDHGIGIPRHQQARLFKPFSRIAHPLTQDVPGMGLGLYITCKLVEALSGTITVESSEGQGTSFTIQLPVKQSSRD